jgi:hypothetical protein
VTNPDIATEIQRLRNARPHDPDVDAARLEELRRIAFSDIRNCFDEQWRLKNLKDLPAWVRASIASWKVTRQPTGDKAHPYHDVIEIRLRDKIAALEQLARHFELLTDQTELSGTVTLEQQQRAGGGRKAQAISDEKPRPGRGARRSKG